MFGRPGAAQRGHGIDRAIVLSLTRSEHRGDRDRDRDAGAGESAEGATGVEPSTQLRQ